MGSGKIAKRKGLNRIGNGREYKEGEDWERKDLERRLLGRGEDKKKRQGMWYNRK